MDILLIGSGGREHALAWKLSQSKLVDKMYAVPGNPGIAEFAECVDFAVEDIPAIVQFSKDHHINLVVIGPEVPLTLGLVDALNDVGILAFGPNKEAAQLEGSKSFAKDLMKKYHIPTAAYEVFTQAAVAKEYITSQGLPLVIKADGLAAGKGVIIPETLEEAYAAIDEIMTDGAFGTAGRQVVIEEFMVGQEASVLAFTDGEHIVPMIAAQDHKRIFDGDKGPNTGGMGAYAPAPIVTQEVQEKVQKLILEPMIKALLEEGIVYQGCLYAGLMIDPEGNPRVVEFNARFGDPETQVVLPLLESDLAEIMLACAQGALGRTEIKWSDNTAVGVVLVADGYPGKYEKGHEITGITKAQSVGLQVFQAGTKLDNGKLVTNGGRVLNVVAVAPDISSAKAKVYNNIELIDFQDKFYRKDISDKAFLS